MKPAAAVTGLGLSDVGRIYGRTELQFAAQAVQRALDDAGLDRSQIDGLLVQAGSEVWFGGGLGIALQNQLGLGELRLLNQMNVAGATAGAMVQYASMAISYGMAKHVVCVWADAALKEGRGGGAVYGETRRRKALARLPELYGHFGANTGYAFAARRHMELYGTTQDQFGAVAIAARQWALRNPNAQMQKPMTLDDYHASRWIVEPFHLLDCCLVTNGGVAVIVSPAEAARSMPQPPVYVAGMGQGHPGHRPQREGWVDDVMSGATTANETAFGMAGITVADVDACEFYDNYTFTTVVTLEDYGFCAKGEGGSFVEGGRIAPGGSLPVNTGGGHLSSYYMWGMTPIHEAVTQTRGQGGARQVPKHDVVIASGNGGMLGYHSCTVFTTEPPA